jgi:DNA-binding transcriptional ArsR family regulator
MERFIPGVKGKHLRAVGNRYECHARWAKELSEQFQAFSTRTTLRGLNSTQTRILTSLLVNAGWVTERIKTNANNKLTTKKLSLTWMSSIFLHASQIKKPRVVMVSKNKKQDALLPNVDEVDKIIHESARLILVANLYLVESADFLFIMQQSGLTFGNLSSHMKKLEDAGYIEVQKEFVNRRPRTLLKLTPQGKKAFENYRQKMKLILDS